MATLVNKLKVIENSAFSLLHQIKDIAGEVLTQADVSEIKLKMYTAAGELVIPEGEDETYTGTILTPAVVVFDDLQEDDPRWPYSGEDEGFNLAIELDGSYVPEAGQYQAEIRITPVAGKAFYRLWAIDAINIFSE